MSEQLKNKCKEILKTRELYIDDLYDLYKELFAETLDTDMAIQLHKLILSELGKLND